MRWKTTNHASAPREQRADRRSEHPPGETRARTVHATATASCTLMPIAPVTPTRCIRCNPCASRCPTDNGMSSAVATTNTTRPAANSAREIACDEPITAEVDDAHHDRQRGSQRHPDAEQQKRGRRDIPVDVPATLVAARETRVATIVTSPLASPRCEEADQRGDGAQEQPGAELGAGKGVSGEGHHHEAHGEEEPAVQAECEPALDRGAGTRGAGRRRFGCCRGQRLGGGCGPALESGVRGRHVGGAQRQEVPARTRWCSRNHA